MVIGSHVPNDITMILFTFFGNGTKTPCSVEGDLVVAAVVVAAFVVVAFVVALVVVVVTL